MITSKQILHPSLVRSRLSRAGSTILVATLTAIMSLSVLAAPAPGDTIYVTDELRLGLYADEQTSGRPMRNLISGDALEVVKGEL